MLSGHIWHQSCVGLMLRCPRAFRLKYVDQVEPDYEGGGFAAPRGTAQHAGCEAGLRAANAGEEPPTALQLLEIMLEAFEFAIVRAQERGATWEPEAAQAAMDTLEAEDVPRIVRFCADPRLRAVRWEGIELGFDHTTQHRRWRGTIDAYGVATSYVPRFGALGRDLVDLYPGDRILCDWKSGQHTALGRIARTIQPQLATYAMALTALPDGPHPAGAPLRAFVGQLRDLDPPKAPTDAEGKRIPRTLPKAPNPAFAEAVGIPLEEVASSKKRPRGIAKWLPEQPNPAYAEAIGRPRGPLFRECEINYALSAETVYAAVQAAEAGLFPASGATSGACSFCDYRRQCAPTLEE